MRPRPAIPGFEQSTSLKWLKKTYLAQGMYANLQNNIQLLCLLALFNLIVLT